MKWLTSLSNVFNKEVTWLKINKWGFLLTKCFMLDVKGFLGLPLHAIHMTCKSSSLIILNVFKYKILTILVEIIYTRGLLKPVRFIFCVIVTVIPSTTCFSSFLTISCRFPWCFCMFSLVFIRFPCVFLQFPLSVYQIF